MPVLVSSVAGISEAAHVVAVSGRAIGMAFSDRRHDLPPKSDHGRISETPWIIPDPAPQRSPHGKRSFVRVRGLVPLDFDVSSFNCVGYRYK
jgi:hypothetical protein